MRKILLIASIFLFSSFMCRKDFPITNLPETVLYSSTWAGTASNQALTKAAFNNGVSTTYMSFASSVNAKNSTTEMLRKDTLLVCLAFGSILNTSYPALSGKAGNNLVIKSDITLKLTLSTASSGLSCTLLGGTQVLYTDVNFTRFYTDASLTNPFSGTGLYYWWSLWAQSIQIDASGFRTGIVGC